MSVALTAEPGCQGKPRVQPLVVWGSQGEPPPPSPTESPALPLVILGVVALAVAQERQGEPQGQPPVSLLPVSSLWVQHLNHYRVAEAQPLVVVGVSASSLPAEGPSGLVSRCFLGVSSLSAQHQGPSDPAHMHVVHIKTSRPHTNRN